MSAAVTAAVQAFASACGVEVDNDLPPDIDTGSALSILITLETDLTGMRGLIAEKGEPGTPAVDAFLASRLPLEAATDAMTVRKA